MNITIEDVAGLIALSGVMVMGTILLIGFFADEIVKIIREIRRRY